MAYPPGVTSNDPHFDVPSVDEEPERETWVFTFGYGHVHPETGESLKNRYVILEGDINSTREEMVRLFGRQWSMQYPNEQAAGVIDYGLQELKL